MTTLLAIVTASQDAGGMLVAGNTVFVRDRVPHCNGLRRSVVRFPTDRVEEAERRYQTVNRNN
jgi:hypothetical protein